MKQESGKGYYLVSYTDLIGGHRTMQIQGYGIVEAVEGFLAQQNVWNIQSVVRIADQTASEAHNFAKELIP